MPKGKRDKDWLEFKEKAMKFNSDIAKANIELYRNEIGRFELAKSKTDNNNYKRLHELDLLINDRNECLKYWFEYT